MAMTYFDPDLGATVNVLPIANLLLRGFEEEVNGHTDYVAEIYPNDAEREFVAQWRARRNENDNSQEESEGA